MPFNVWEVDHPRFHDPVWQAATANETLGMLLPDYDVVLYADADELVFPDPSHASDGLRAYLAALDSDVVRCTGRSVVQRPGEPALNFSRPLLAQRSVWMPDPAYDKPAVSTVLVKRSLGAHAIEDDDGVELDVPRDPGLLMVHLARADYETRRRRVMRLQRDLGTTLEERIARWGAPPFMASQWLLSPEGFNDWFAADPADVEPIPERFRQLA